MSAILPAISADPYLKSADALVREVVRLSHRLRILFSPLDDFIAGGAQTVGLMQTLMTVGPLTVAELARSRHVSRQWMQRSVRVLIAEKILAEVDNPAHKQSKRLRVTDYGRQILKQAERAAVPVLRSLNVEGYSKESVQSTIFFLQTMNAKVDEFLKYGSRLRERPQSKFSRQSRHFTHGREANRIIR